MKYNDETFELIKAAVEQKIAYPEQRWGQSLSNTAWLKYGVRECPRYVDPFNDDSKCDLFLQWFQEEHNGRTT